jgi:hypothetical protein
VKLWVTTARNLGDYLSSPQSHEDEPQASIGSIAGESSCNWVAAILVGLASARGRVAWVGSRADAVRRSRVTHGFIHPVVRLIRSAAVGRSDLR